MAETTGHQKNGTLPTKAYVPNAAEKDTYPIMAEKVRTCLGRNHTHLSWQKKMRRGVQLARQQNYFRTTTKPISARYLHLVPTKKFVSNCSCTESCSTYRQPRHNLRASAFNQIRILLQLHLPHSVHRGHRRISTNESSFDIHFAASTAAASAASTAN